MELLKLNELTKKRLDETYIVVYAIKNEVNIKKADIIEKNDIYTLIGIDIKGIRHLLNIYADKINNSHFWLDSFETLKSRGVKNILFLSVDDNKNMKRTAKIAFPNIVFTDSLTSIYPKFYKYISERSSKNIASKIKELYTQKTLDEYKHVFKIFNDKYNNVIHKTLIKKYLNNIENTYKYSQNIRKLLFKHSANVQYYDKIRLTFDDKKYINSFDDLYNELDNNKYRYFGYTSFQKKEWTLILNDLIQIYPNIEFI